MRNTDGSEMKRKRNNDGKQKGKKKRRERGKKRGGIIMSRTDGKSQMERKKCNK